MTASQALALSMALADTGGQPAGRQANGKRKAKPAGSRQPRVGRDVQKAVSRKV